MRFSGGPEKPLAEHFASWIIFSRMLLGTTFRWISVVWPPIEGALDGLRGRFSLIFEMCFRKSIWGVAFGEGRRKGQGSLELSDSAHKRRIWSGLATPSGFAPDSLPVNRQLLIGSCWNCSYCNGLGRFMGRLLEAVICGTLGYYLRTWRLHFGTLGNHSGDPWINHLRNFSCLS